MDKELSGIPGVVCFLDDVIITGFSLEDHLSSVEKVLEKLSESGLRLKRSKCEFLCDSVTFLGVLE